ncbi:tail fiber domain-containing protein [Pantoea stewartii subsp. indologenes]|uniref:tail fiber domain-containing protein n=1 Tax=Pantoea stewartii TaxID=66269 RepID=UPI0024E00EF5|nr:tail fiber domain-containing protein [Pantoea stewartii]MDK2632006.1 tail fiber domain-containing protein [Pantoea stewartii subsp. indologenes]
MPAGTIALTNKSTTVSGTGTSFTTELKVGDFVYVTVGGASYTLVAANITSDTQLTLAVAFDGPTTSGLAWNAVPASLQVAITQKILNDFASVARGRILDFQNWQKIYSDEQAVTVTRPDRSQFTGPSWGYMAAQYANKLDKSALDAYAKNGANNDITGLSGLTTALSIEQGGTGAKTKADAWKNLATFGSSAGTAAQGNDSRLGSVDGKTGGKISSGVTISAGGLVSGGQLLSAQHNTFLVGSQRYHQGGKIFGYSADSVDSLGDRYWGMWTEYYEGGPGYLQLLFSVGTLQRYWTFQDSGNAVASGAWINNSDKNIKTNIKRIEKPLEKMRMVNGYTWDRLDNAPSGQGFIAQEIQEVFPSAVFEGGATTLKDGSVVKKTLSVDVSGVSAALHHEAILALMEKIEQRDAAIEELQKRVKAIDGLDA